MTEQDVHGGQMRRWGRHDPLFVKTARRKKKVLKFMEVCVNTEKEVD